MCRRPESTRPLRAPASVGGAPGSASRTARSDGDSVGYLFAYPRVLFSRLRPARENVSVPVVADQKQRALHGYADSLRLKFSTDIAGGAEDQLKAPVERLLRAIGGVFGLAVVAKSESPVEGLGRPDFGVAVGNLLTGTSNLSSRV